MIKRKFSPLITVFSLILAALMLKASAWQWERYKFKKELVDTYTANSSAPAKTLGDQTTADELRNLIFHKVEVLGQFDYEHQFIVANRRHASGPGYWLMTPFYLSGGNRLLIVSRGFIPFAEDTPESWSKYSFTNLEKITGVVQPSVEKSSIFSPNNPSVQPQRFVKKWLYPEISAMARQLQGDSFTTIFLQQIAGPTADGFPAEAVSVQVPPSTHFGYTFEWIILAILTVMVPLLVQHIRWSGRHPQGQ
ncbi:MAG: SURF1 family protein [bacterium]|nr:SURF1 family protein [bacterium]